MEQIDGQITMTELLQSRVRTKRIMDLTSWINSQGDAQYTQIKKLISKACEDYHLPLDKEQIDRLTNVVSIYVLEQSSEYMHYLKECSQV